MLQAINKLKDGVLDILLPKFCIGCGREGQYICKDCEIFLSEVENTIPGLTSVWEYEGLMEKLIHEIKYRGEYHIIDELVEKVLEKIELKLPEDFYITYVPMHKKRERERGFNQSELIARKLGAVYFREVNKLLVKVRDNRSQVGLSPKEREENVKGVFEFWTNFGHAMSNGHRMSTSHVQNVLLVDDVYTTGATMNECKRVLKKAGVKNIWGFTLSRKLTI